MPEIQALLTTCTVLPASTMACIQCIVMHLYKPAIELAWPQSFLRIKLELRQKTLPVAPLFGTHNLQLFFASRPQKNVAGTARTFNRLQC